jgi:hypothetical protein
MIIWEANEDDADKARIEGREVNGFRPQEMNRKPEILGALFCLFLYLWECLIDTLGVMWEGLRETNRSESSIDGIQVITGMAAVMFILCLLAAWASNMGRLSGQSSTPIPVILMEVHNARR